MSFRGTPARNLDPEIQKPQDDRVIETLDSCVRRNDRNPELLTLYSILPLSSSELIIEYSSKPPNRGILENADIRYREANRVCADVVEVSLIIRDGELREFMFDGYMSIVATACVSITGELLEGWKVENILKLNESFIHENIGTDISPRRRYASLIGLLAVKNGIHEFLQDGKKEDFSDIVVG